MRIVVAIGGNALLKRGEPISDKNQRRNVREAAGAIANLYPGNELVISHGNGPQVGLLALQAACYDAVEAFPLDVLGAQTEGVNPRPSGRGIKRVGRGLYPCQHPYFKETPALRPGSHPAGMIGYMIEQELGNILPFEQPLASILTMVEVDATDPAFQNPTKSME